MDGVVGFASSCRWALTELGTSAAALRSAWRCRALLLWAQPSCDMRKALQTLLTQCLCRCVALGVARTGCVVPLLHGDCLSATLLPVPTARLGFLLWPFLCSGCYGILPMDG